MMPNGRAIASIVIAIAALVFSGCATHRTGLSSDALAKFPEHIELTATPFFPQDDYQCGPAALATVLSTVGIDTQPDRLTDEVFLPGRKGSLAIELAAAIRSRGLLPYSLERTPSAILEELAVGRAVLVMQNLGFKIKPIWHFAVVIGYDARERTFILRSGTVERLVVKERSFMRSWDLAERWALVVLKPDELPAAPDLQRFMSAAAGLESIGRLRAAATAYGVARLQWPHSVWPTLGLANIEMREGNLAAAESGYRAALALDPNNVVANNNLGEILWKRGCVSDARPLLERALELARGSSLEAAVANTLREMEAQPVVEGSCAER